MIDDRDFDNPPHEPVSAMQVTAQERARAELLVRAAEHRWDGIAAVVAVGLLAALIVAAAILALVVFL